jgi:Gram-negative bacterial TonB protein C-terminal
MDENAIEAVRKWRFRAGVKDGKPVDVRIQVAVGFSVAPEKNTWVAGPLLFDVLPGAKPPILKSGSMPKLVRQSGNETVVLQFTVDPRGEVTDVHAVQGESSSSLPVFMASVSKWKFAPALDGNMSVAATGNAKGVIAALAIALASVARAQPIDWSKMIWESAVLAPRTEEHAALMLAVKLDSQSAPALMQLDTGSGAFRRWPAGKVPAAASFRISSDSSFRQ